MLNILRRNSYVLYVYVVFHLAGERTKESHNFVGCLVRYCHVKGPREEHFLIVKKIETEGYCHIKGTVEKL